MAEADTAVAETTIPFEDGDGQSTPLPAELAPDTPAVQAPETPAVAPVVVPPVVVPEVVAPPVDAAKAGILADLGRTRDENKTLKQFREQAAPLLIELQKHPDILAELQSRATGQPAAAPRGNAPPAQPTPHGGPSAEDLTQLATDLVLYKADGSGEPDLEAAKRIWTRNERQVSEAVDAAIAKHVTPMQQRETRSQAQQARDAIVATAKTAGVEGPELEQILDGFMVSNPQMLMDPQIGVAAIVMARGMKGIVQPPVSGQPPAPVIAPPAEAPPAPVFMERPGSRAPQPLVMSGIEQKVARSRGMTPEAWGAATAPLVNAAKGQQHIVLEED